MLPKIIHFIQKLLDPRRLYRVIEIDTKGQETKTLYYIYESNIQINQAIQLYYVIGDEKHLSSIERDRLIDGTYLLPTGIINQTTYFNWYKLNKVNTSKKLLSITTDILDSIANKIVKIIELDLEIENKLISVNSFEKNLLWDKRYQFKDQYYQPFKDTLAELFIKLENERLLVSNSDLLWNSKSIEKQIDG